ncbi:unnamed protein product, partial [Hapterophycus canaliculatus]
VRAWEVKTRQLALLTPRTPMEVGRGMCRLRETDEMRKKRLDYRWKVEKILAAEIVRRRENPTPEEAAEAALEAIVHTIERREDRKRRRLEHNTRTLERARWHPSTSGYLMQRLAVPASTTAIVAASANGNGESPDTKTIVTDADFFRMKLTQDGSATLWGQEIEQNILEMSTKKTSGRRLEGRGLAAALHLHLPERLRAGGRLFLPAATNLSTLPSLLGLTRVRPLGDLKREITTLGAAARTAVTIKREPRDAGSGEISGATPASEVGRGEPAGIKAAAQGSEEEAALEAAASLEAPGLATAASTSVDNTHSVASTRRNEIATAIAALPVAPSEKRAKHRDRAYARTSSSGEGPPAGEETSKARSSTIDQDESGARASSPGESPPDDANNSNDRSSPMDRGGAGSTAEGSPGAADNSEGRRRRNDQEGPLNPVALAAVAPLNEQMRGIRTKLALKIERGELDPSRAGDAAAAMAKRALAAAGKTVGFSKK